MCAFLYSKVGYSVLIKVLGSEERFCLTLFYVGGKNTSVGPKWNSFRVVWSCDNAKIFHFVPKWKLM